MATIRRLGPEDAAAVVDCFRRVYGDSYANERFYDVTGLAAAMRSGATGSVGAVDGNGVVLGHMAMTVHPEATVVELGNTVVDPAARGGGLAWKVGAELSAWCRELGYQGFLHYPTTDHHIMQRQSVKAGFETGLMLGYIPSETHGKVGESGEPLQRRRQAATIVYEPYGPGASFSGYVPAAYQSLFESLVVPTGLPRTWQLSTAAPAGEGSWALQHYAKRGLSRLAVQRAGTDLAGAIKELASSAAPCQQIDFNLADPAVGTGVDLARAQGFRFCGWLPGFRQGDVLRLQRLTAEETDFAPALENPQAAELLRVFLSEQ